MASWLDIFFFRSSICLLAFLVSSLDALRSSFALFKLYSEALIVCLILDYKEKILKRKTKQRKDY